jgi:type III pantothenate kinase
MNPNLPEVCCLDIGNTSCQIVNFQGTESCKSQKIGTHEFIQEPSLLLPPSQINIPVSYCSVVPKATEALQKHILDFGFQAQQIGASQNLIPIAYPLPQEIGADRIANSIATYKKYTLPALVVDIGTATTFDVVTEKGYEGGVILPGPQGLLDFLSSKTALLPKVNYNTAQKPLTIIGKSTRDAMLAGVSFGYNPMIKAIVSKLKKEIAAKATPCTISLVKTGGNANLCKLPNFIHDPLLTHKGLYLAHNELCYRKTKV